MEGWGKVRAAAQYAGVSPKTLKKWINQGGLKHVRMPGILVKYSWIDEYLEQHVSRNDDLEIIDQVVDEFMASLSD